MSTITERFPTVERKPRYCNGVHLYGKCHTGEHAPVKRDFWRQVACVDCGHPQLREGHSTGNGFVSSQPVFQHYHCDQCGADYWVY